MLYGIQVRQSVRLTEIGRALQEPISLKKTEYRLRRQLRRKAYGNFSPKRSAGWRQPASTISRC
jgi:hypothetical protein